VPISRIGAAKVLLFSFLCKLFKGKSFSPSPFFHHPSFIIHLPSYIIHLPSYFSLLPDENNKQKLSFIGTFFDLGGFCTLFPTKTCASGAFSAPKRGCRYILVRVLSWLISWEFTPIGCDFAPLIVFFSYLAIRSPLLRHCFALLSPF